MKRRNLLQLICKSAVTPAVVLGGCGSIARSSEPSSNFFDSAGFKIRYLSAGSGDPVILAHGFSSSAESQWVRTGVVKALSMRYSVFAMDGMGHGQSAKPHDANRYGPEAAMDIIRLMDHLQLSRAHIVGYSMGAILNGYLVTQVPSRYMTCTIAGATPHFRWTSEDQRRLALEADEMAQGSRRSQILRLWPKDKPLPEESQLRELSSLEGRDYKALAAAYRGVGLATVSPQAVSAIRVPLLGIVGAEDPYLADFDAMKQLSPAMQLVVVRGASHRTVPGRQEFVDALMDFFAKHSA